MAVIFYFIQQTHIDFLLTSIRFNKYLLCMYLVLLSTISEVTEDDKTSTLYSRSLQSSKKMLFICYDADGERLLDVYFPPLFI